MAELRIELGALGHKDMRRIDGRFRRVEPLKLEPFRRDLARNAVRHSIAPRAHAILQRQLLGERSAGIARRHQNSGVSSEPMSFGRNPSCAAWISARLTDCIPPRSMRLNDSE